MHVIVLTPSVKDLEIQTPCADLEGVDWGGGLPLKIQIQSYFKNLHTKMTENSPWTPPPLIPGKPYLFLGPYNLLIPLPLWKNILDPRMQNDLSRCMYSAHCYMQRSVFVCAY